MAVLFITSTRIGDAVLSTGLLAHLIDTYPEDEVTVACGAPASPLFEAVPRLKALHVMRKKSRGMHWVELWRATVGTRWRLVVDLRRSALPWLLRADRRCQIPTRDEGIHRVELISKTLGMPPRAPRIFLDDVHRRAIDRLVGDAGPFVVIAPGANWIGKTWPADRFADLATRIAPDRRVLVVGTEAEREMIRPVFDRLPADRLIDGIDIGLLQTYAAIERADLFVGNDSGLMHLAAATGRPTVGLFGPTDERQFGPWGENGMTVRTPESLKELIAHPDYDYRNAGCMMESLTVDAVASAIGARWPGLIA